MSIKSLFKSVNPNKILGYALATGGAIPAAIDSFRLAAGDLSASGSLAQSFGVIAAGISIAQTGNSKTPPPAATQTQARPVLLMPHRDFRMV
jgi:hypothetical protein